MTEQERMKAGYIWWDDDENLGYQAETRGYVREFNSLAPDDEEGRRKTLKKIFGHCDDNVWIVPPLNVIVGKYTSIGEGTYANMNLTLIDDCEVTIGKRVLFGPNVTVCTTGHPIAPNHRGDGMYSFPIHIGDGAWIGANSIILPGVTIGENSVIGAGSVVTNDIPANVIAFGSPCHVFREINEKDQEFYFRDKRFDDQPKRD
ncbi:MAG: sugar O-acetyltransferase [Lachnospiraceae bacterium]|nr:sugar O-acetyltransferase [Lachnospiraceae bacterium]